MSSATIESQVQEFVENTASKAPAEIGGVFFGEQASLERDADRAAFVKAGDVLEDFSLPDATGNPVTLESLVAPGLAVVVFYRGAWCPYCNIALGAYRAELAPELARRGVSLAAISPQQPDGSLTMQEKHDLAFPVLSDHDNQVAEKLGIVFETAPVVRETQLAIGIDIAAVNGQSSPSLPMPTVLVIDADRVVRFADVRPNYTERTEVADILRAVDMPRSQQGTVQLPRPAA